MMESSEGLVWICQSRLRSSKNEKTPSKGMKKGEEGKELDGSALQFYPCRQLRVEKRIEKGGGESRIGRKDGGEGVE